MLTQISRLVFGKTIHAASIHGNCVETINLFGPETFTMPQLYDIDGATHATMSPYSISVPPANIYIVKDGKCVVGKEEVFTRDNQVVQEITSQRSNPMIGRSIKQLVASERLKGTVVNLSLSGLEDNYYHFNVEFLARYYLHVVSGLAADYIVFPQNTGFQREFLRLLGVSAQVIGKKDFASIQADRIIAPSMINNWRQTRYCGKPHYLKEWAPSWLRDAYRLVSVPASGKYAAIKRVYVSRERAASRRVVNETELTVLLKQHGFTCFHLEALPLREQIELFSGIDMLVAPHGAGLINMSYCAKPIKMLEIYPNQYHDSSYRIQAKLLGHHYDFCIGEPPQADRGRTQDQDLVADLNAIRRWLSRCG